MNNREARRIVRNGVTDGIFAAAIYLSLAALIVTSVANYSRPYDDTDFNGNRSGMEVLTDCLTGLQYLSTREGGLTPRLNNDQTQIRKDCK